MLNKQERVKVHERLFATVVTRTQVEGRELCLADSKLQGRSGIENLVFVLLRWPSLDLSLIIS
jgi:hypothetical protein